jgi:hypothetical protein
VKVGLSYRTIWLCTFSRRVDLDLYLLEQDVATYSQCDMGCMSVHVGAGGPRMQLCACTADRQGGLPGVLKQCVFTTAGAPADMTGCCQQSHLGQVQLAHGMCQEVACSLCTLSCIWHLCGHNRYHAWTTVVSGGCTCAMSPPHNCAKEQLAGQLWCCCHKAVSSSAHCASPGTR